MSHQNPFQPWKPHTPGLLNLANSNYQMPNLFHHHHLASPLTSSTNGQTFSTSSAAPQSVIRSAGDGGVQHQQQVMKSGPSNLQKINSLDKLTGLSSVVNSEELSADERNAKLQHFAEKNISNEAKQKILHILEQISDLSPLERLLLYLRLPGGHPETDPLRQSQNPLGQRSEINHTINWVKSHLEEDENVSIPKQEVYDDYVAYCGRTNIKPLSTADFGKVMKQVFPNIRPRRLGTRGNSRYCYAAMRKATKLGGPVLPDLRVDGGAKGSSGDSEACDPESGESWGTIKNWADNLLSGSFESMEQLAEHIKKQHLNSPTSSRQLLHKKLLQRELKEKRKLNESKKKRKKRRKLASLSQSVELNESSKSSNDEDGDEEKRPPKPEEGSSSSSSSLLKVTQCSTNTNSSCDSKSAETKKPITTTTTTTSTNPTTTTTTSSALDSKKLRWAHPNNNNNNNNCKEKESVEEEQEKATKRLKPRLGHISCSGNSSANLEEESKASPIDLPISRERIESLCTIDKDELDDYLLPDNSQDQEAELLQIFQTQGKSASDAPGVPLLENYQLYSNGKSQQLSELRNILAQNLSQNPQNPRVASSQTAFGTNAPGNANRPASSALVMLSQGRAVTQQPMVRVPVNPNTFVPIRQASGGQTFVSPRSATKNRPSLAPLQTFQFKQEFPTSAPTSPSLQQNYRYYPHAITQAAQTAPSHSSQILSNRSRSVPVPQFDQPYPDSAMNSMNPTPVPSEMTDFGGASESSLMLDAMFADAPATIKCELDYYEGGPDELMVDIRHHSIVSRSVPSTPLPAQYSNGLGTNLKYHMNNNNNNNNSYKSVPTTPVNGPSHFRYTPPASRDYLINGYALEKCGASDPSADKSQVGADSFQGTNYMQNAGADYRQASDPMIESDIFNDIS